MYAGGTQLEYKDLPYEPKYVVCCCSCGRNVVGCRTNFLQPHSAVCETPQWLGFIDSAKYAHEWNGYDEWYRKWDRNDNRDGNDYGVGNDNRH